MNVPSHSPMAPPDVGRSAGPPSSSEVRGATEWQTGQRADSLAVFCIVVTETEVTGVGVYNEGRGSCVLASVPWPTRSLLRGGYPKGFVNEGLQRLAHHLPTERVFELSIGEALEDLLQHPRQQSLEAPTG